MQTLVDIVANAANKQAALQEMEKGGSVCKTLARGVEALDLRDKLIRARGLRLLTGRNFGTASTYSNVDVWGVLGVLWALVYVSEGNARSTVLKLWCAHKVGFEQVKQELLG
jgi:hypothetical protein